LDARRHTLRVEYPPSPVVVEVDPLRITQVLTNLLTNAIKYTPPGGLIWLGTRLVANAFIIYVRDSGVGLAPGAITKIFNMFAQIEPGRSRAEGGLGIGLALAKGLVELHGGNIDASSPGLGQGSEFAVSLPISLIVPSAEQSPLHLDSEPRPAVSKCILVADDNRDGAETMGMLLQMSGHVVHLAHSGTEAYEVAKRVRPDIAVLDIGMPDITGYEVAEKIRREAWGESVMLIAITGWGQAEDKRRAVAAGFDHHLTKPVDPNQLEELLIQ
jgi:CheY-like chemotaxis protein